MVRLTVSVYPPLPYSQLFVISFCVFFILDYDYMCSETDFTQEKSHFLESPILPYCLLLLCHKILS